MKKVLIAVLICILTTDGLQAKANFEKAFQTWYNKPISELIDFWGTPDDINYKNGQKIYTWLSEENSSSFFAKKCVCSKIIVSDITDKIIYAKQKGICCLNDNESVNKLKYDAYKSAKKAN